MKDFKLKQKCLRFFCTLHSVLCAVLSRWTLDVGHWTLTSFRTLYSALCTALYPWMLDVKRWTGIQVPETRAASRALFSGTFCAILLFLVLTALFPNASPSASTVETDPLKEIFRVDPDLILGPGQGVSVSNPLVQRALSLADTKEVKTQLEHFLTDKRQEIRTSLGLSTKYLDHIKPVLEEYGLPAELAFLCIIESGYHHSAKSHAGAVGMWQMIRATSRRFDLVTDNWVDERLDFVRSTEGAARFLCYLKERFDDWDHVLAAYNAGEGRVNKAVKKAEILNLEPTFENLRLPRETRIYVPAFYAALLIALEPERYGIFPDYQLPVDFVEVKIPGGVPLASVSRQMGCDVDSLRFLNPSILRDRVPFMEGGFFLRVPCSVEPEKARIVAKNLSEIQFVSYRVRKGDTLWDISRKFGVSMSRISRAGQRKGSLSRIFPGEILLVAFTAGETG